MATRKRTGGEKKPAAQRRDRPSENGKRPIESYEHKGAERLNNPPVGLVTPDTDPDAGQKKKTYAYDPHLDPQLVWAGKAEHTSFEVPTVSLHVHERIDPRTIIEAVRKRNGNGWVQGSLFEEERQEPLREAIEFYRHKHGWSNRLIAGDSLLVMNSLLEKEGLAGKVQMIYIDPPYGIRYGSNFQPFVNKRDVKDGKDEDLTSEPEQIRAFRDTWELGIHSYLTYLRDRLLLARELLTESGSVFVQISDENVHHVRELMDETFGAENFCCLIAFRKTTGANSPQARVNVLATTNDFAIWYARNIASVKYRQLYVEKDISELRGYNRVESPDGKIVRDLDERERADQSLIPKGWRVFQTENLTSSGFSETLSAPFTFHGKAYRPAAGNHWKTTARGLRLLTTASRLTAGGNTLNYKRYLDDFPVYPLAHSWQDISVGYGGDTKTYVVQTSTQVLMRCLLMTTDPGDLVFDPTCGSGTTAYVAEQWGRRWITIDTSRIALNLAKSRLMTARFPYYKLYDSQTCDLRQGFLYKKVLHVEQGDIAKNEPSKEETLFDQPEEDTKRLRIAGPFTVETLQNFEPVSPAALAAARKSDAEMGKFEDVIFEHLKSAGVKTGDKAENAVFHRIDRLADADLHAEGFYQTAQGEAKAYLHIGPKFGTVSKLAVNNAVKACRRRGDADWLIILGFSFESDIESKSVTTSQGQFQVTKVRMHDDLLQEGLLKKDRKAASFVTIGEPDIALHQKKGEATVEIKGLDIYDPIKDEVKSRDVHDIAYWMVDTDYDGANFIVRQAFFCGGDKDEFDQWKKGLENLALLGAKKKAEKTLKIEIDEEAFARLYGHVSHPFPVKKGQQIAVRVISQFGEETTKVLVV